MLLPSFFGDVDLLCISSHCAAIVFVHVLFLQSAASVPRCSADQNRIDAITLNAVTVDLLRISNYCGAIEFVHVLFFQSAASALRCSRIRTDATESITCSLLQHPATALQSMHRLL